MPLAPLFEERERTLSKILSLARTFLDPIYYLSHFLMVVSASEKASAYRLWLRTDNRSDLFVPGEAMSVSWPA